MIQVNAKEKLLDLPTAAELAGFSLRQFRRIIEEDRIPLQRIGTKAFILDSDLRQWQWTLGERRLDAALQQLDGWIRESEARSFIFGSMSGADGASELLVIEAAIFGGVTVASVISGLAFGRLLLGVMSVFLSSHQQR